MEVLFPLGSWSKAACILHQNCFIAICPSIISTTIHLIDFTLCGSPESCKQQSRRPSNRPVPNRLMLNGHCTSFCNLPKHSHPLHAMIGQLYGCKKGDRVLNFSFFTQLFLSQRSILWMCSRRDGQKMCSVISIFKWYYVSLLSMMLLRKSLNTFNLLHSQKVHVMK